MVKNMNKFWNVPNVLTLFRLALVPVFVLVFFVTEGNHIPALVVFIIASLTDMLDGFIARKYNLITPYGVVLDPLADKLLKSATLICFAIVDIIPVWLTATLITIDVAMIITGVCLYKQKITIPSNFLGKLGTLVMTIGLILCFFDESLGGWNLYILYAGLIIIIASVIVYILLNYKRVFNVDKTKSTKENRESDAVIVDTTATPVVDTENDDKKSDTKENDSIDSK